MTLSPTVAALADLEHAEQEERLAAARLVGIVNEGIQAGSITGVSAALARAAIAEFEAAQRAQFAARHAHLAALENAANRVGVRS